jgi:hypothetical protein
MRTMNITLASENDKGITLRTAQLETALVFSDGDRYYLEIQGLPFAIPMTLNRGGESLYSGKLDPIVTGALRGSVGLPQIGAPVTVTANLGKNLKTVTG